jgi:beta-glucosidase
VSRTITPEIAAEVDRILSTLTLDDKLSMVDGDTEFWPGLIEMMGGGYNRAPYVAGLLPDRGIDGVRFSDGPRGVVMGNSTCFPVAMARGASFDVDLEEAIGNVIGREVRAQGGNLFAGVCVNLLRHPAWGRAQETYGEDPMHVGELGAALTRGAQKHVMACVKHFALNSMENARFTVDVTCDESTLNEVYLPHFKRIVDEGVAGVMSAYNSLNGEWCGQSVALLRDKLKGEWGFDGFVMTDFIFGMRDSATAINAGQDLEMPFRMIHAAELRGAIESGTVSLDTLNDSCRRLLGQQIRFRAVGSTTTRAYDPSVVASAAHRALARRASAESMVLLRNSGVLPLRPGLRSLAVIGSLADTANTGDGGSSKVHPPEVITPLAGLRAALEPLGVTVTYDDGSNIDRAANVAASADVAIVVVGFTHEDEGEYVGLAGPDELRAKFPTLSDELKPALGAALGARESGRGMAIGGDRVSLELHDDHVELIGAVSGAQPDSIVVVECGSAVLMESWRDLPAAVLLSWYPGMEGGHALADVVCGRVNPSGHLPFAIPTSATHLPAFDRDATSVVYGPLHGQWLLDNLGELAAFPFGYGLSYTTFEIVGARSVSELELDVLVRNTGDATGACVVQIYRRVDGHPTKLCGFTKVTLEPDASMVVRVNVSPYGASITDRAGRDAQLIAAQFAGDPEAVVVKPQ